MKCPNNSLEAIRCNQLLDVAEELIDSQGVVSFRFAQIAKQAGCSTNTLYKYFETKEDVLVCLFLRNTTSCHMPIFIKRNPDLTIQQQAILPVLFTFEAVKKSPIFNVLRVVSINSMFWKLASAEKIEILKNRVNHFWSRIYNPLEEARLNNILNASEQDVLDLTQAIYFFLGGAVSSYESQLMDEKYLKDKNDTCYRHLSRMMNRYKWQTPITAEMMQDMAERIHLFFEKEYSQSRTCETCMHLGKSKNCSDIPIRQAPM